MPAENNITTTPQQPIPPPSTEALALARLRQKAISHPLQQCQLTIYVPPNAVGAIIGRGGRTILSVQQEAKRRSLGHDMGVRIHVVGGTNSNNNNNNSSAAPSSGAATWNYNEYQQQQQQQQQATSHPNMPPPPNLPRTAIPSSGSPMRETMSSQVTDISRLSLSELLRLSANGERGTADSSFLMELVRQSDSELMQSGLGRDTSIRFTGISFKEDGTTTRPSESTTNSSLMQRDTVLSFAPNDEFSSTSTAAQSGQQQDSARLSSDMSVDNNEETNDVAEMLIRLSRDREKKSGGTMEMEI
mmetsp:Transcript_13169/g.18865  ORF Transcript_13169/g.18865 Transcript_13169/m.18865 type:complete len:302 (-) Transcript_13169:208-1113(-)